MFLLLILLIFSIPKLAQSQPECQPVNCSSSGPIIRFPFRLITRQPAHCGYPGFDLSCNPNNNNTEFQFQFPVQASTRNIILPISARATVHRIDYASQVFQVSIQNGSCLPTRVPTVNSTASRFQLTTNFEGYTLFNYSGPPGNRLYSGPIACLGSGRYQVYGYRSFYSVSDVSVSNCVKMYNISDVSEIVLTGPREYLWDDTWLRWDEPFCGGCESRGMYCGLRNVSGTSNETECFEIPREPQQQRNRGVSRNVVTAIILVGVVLTVLAIAALYRVYSVKMTKRDNERRIQQFLEDYKALRPSRYTYAEVKRITENFKHKLGQGGYGTVFKGKLSNDILVAVKVLNNTKGNGEEFINEVATIGKIHHVNVVRLVGYCADGYKRALVYEFLQNDSLEKYISSGNQSRTIGWEKMHKIAIGIAKGIDYLHQGCNQRILHFDIKPHNILLDNNLNPKVADFGLAKLCSKERSFVTMTAARGTIGYIAPEVFSRNFGNVSYKSDIYSFGMLLLDMVGGRKNFHAGGEEDSSQVYFPEWMYNQLDKGKNLAIQIEKEEESDVVKRLIIVGLWCIQWYPADRPSTKVVIQMLEGEKMPVMPPNPFADSTPVNTTTANSNGSAVSSEIFRSAQTSLNSD